LDLGLEGRGVLVSGAHRGTGLVIAQHFAREGARVLVHGFTQAQADEACAEIGAGIPVAGDITTDAGADALFAQCAGHGESPDILVNNYGVADRGSWSESTSADWVDAYQKNVLSAQRLIQRALPAMRRRNSGRIINLGTVGSTRPNARSPHYYAAKGALATMTMSLARELAGTGIRVNLVSPGLILTPEVKASFMERARKDNLGDRWEDVEPHVAADIPIRRIPRREEIADFVVFLASDRADAIHGQNLRIDGGALGTLT
jgi:NAD(P)-dependent dehydrogenase (short-subunit alcohol dehydrogenase family)